MAKTKEPTREENLLEEARTRFSECEERWSDSYDKAYDDYEFTNGIGQWEAETIRQRKLEGRPALTLNNLLPYKNQVVNDIRQADIAIRVSPVDDGGDVDTADVFAGIIRNIEKQSRARQHYCNAADTAVSSGYGYMRVTTDYCDPKTFDQEIYIEGINNFQSVYLDPNAQEVDGSDAEYGFVFDDMPEERFKALYPDAEVCSIEDGQGWVKDNHVRVAEYYYKDYEKFTIYKVAISYPDGTTGTLTATQEELDALEAEGATYEEIDSRESELVKVKHALISGTEILEETEWLGKYIPIVPVYGLKTFLNGEVCYQSLIHQAKDAQRMFNYWKTASTEFIALQQKSPWVGYLGSFKSKLRQWQESHLRNIPFLEIDPVYGKNEELLPPPTKAPPITGSTSMMQEAMSARDDVMFSLGMPQANMGQQGNEVSGIAIRNRQIEGDNATFHFVDNLTASITQVGRILVDLIPKIYSERKILRIIGDDGEEKTVPVNSPFAIDQETGDKIPMASGLEKAGIYELNVGKYDVVADIGASYSSKRQETADKLTQAMGARPELFDVVGDLFFDALDLPKGKEIAKRLRSIMQPELFEDDPNAARLQAAALQIQQLNEQLLNMEAALDMKNQDAEHEKAKDMAEIELKRQEMMNDTAKTQADIAKIEAEIREKNVGTTAETLQMLQNAMQDIVLRLDDVQAATEIQLAMQEMDEEMSEPLNDDTKGVKPE